MELLFCPPFLTSSCFSLKPLVQFKEFNPLLDFPAFISVLFRLSPSSFRLETSLYSVFFHLYLTSPGVWRMSGTLPRPSFLVSLLVRVAPFFFLFSPPWFPVLFHYFLLFWDLRRTLSPGELGKVQLLPRRFNSLSLMSVHGPSFTPPFFPPSLFFLLV